MLSPQAQASWEAAGCVFIPTSERILSIRLKIHLGFATAIAVYAPTNPTNSTSEASAASVALLESLEARCSDLGLTISCKKTKLLAVVPSGSYSKPSPVSFRPGDDLIDVVSHFEYLGSVMSDNCSRLLWLQKQIKCRTKLRIFSSVIIPALLYGLETVALQECQCKYIGYKSLWVGALRVILGLSLWERKRSTTILKLGRQQRVSAALNGCRLRFLAHIHCYLTTICQRSC